jgi:UrcA family protein
MKRNLQPSRTFIAVGIIAGCLLAAPAVNAADLSPTSDGYRVRYSPSELTNSSQAEDVYHKLKFAAREVCESGAIGRSLAERVKTERCTEKLLASLVQQIDQPMLTSLYESEISKVG